MNGGMSKVDRFVIEQRLSNLAEPSPKPRISPFPSPWDCWPLVDIKEGSDIRFPSNDAGLNEIEDALERISKDSARKNFCQGYDQAML